jgi:Tol biopolymer transport system component/predicted Ser/Thr protein kinase
MTPESIAHYRISSKLGEGAMGEVYRATDSKLGREVAIKLIPEDFARDALRMVRFTREAQVLASLNHPNIAAIYGVEDRALIMELVEGQTLTERIAQGAIPLEDALDIARQIADGLEAAHDKGIVHRDLKPSNIKITPGGTVKLLDFGLAKSDGPWATTTPIEEAPTLTVASTGAGVVLGTAAYMAPEQARGRNVDRRADIWAFGVILYEMLTGQQAFAGETVTDVLASVVRHEPDLTRVPTKVRPLLERCLAKDPKKRLRDAGDAMLLLDLPTAATGAPANRTMTWALGGVAALLALALAWVSFTHFRESAPTAATTRFLISYPAETSPIGSGIFAISPDGRQVAFGAFGSDGVARVWLRPIDQVRARVLPGAEINRNSLALFWSPDSSSLAYWDDMKLKRIAIAGGPAQTIADVDGNVLGGSWNRDGSILFGSATGVMQVPASGGTPSPVTKAAAGQPHAAPHFLPDGRRFLYLRGGEAGTRAVFIGSLDAKPEEQSSTPLVKADYGVSYVPGPNPQNGQLLFLRDTALMAQPFDASRAQLTGEPTPVVERVAVSNVGPGATVGLGYFAASETGSLVYFNPVSRSTQLTWFNREGQRSGGSIEAGRSGVLKVSPDGARVALERTDEANNRDIWQIDLARGLTTRFTFDAAPDVQPVWSPDGTRIAWQSNRGGFGGLYSKLADGSGGDELLYKLGAGTPPGLTDWTRDGRFLVYSYQSDIWALPVSGNVEDRKPVLLVQADQNQLGAYVSPDQRWIAYLSNESGRQELYVQPFTPGTGSATQVSPAAGKWMLSNGTLGMARWRADSTELLFLGTDGGVMAVDIAPGPVFRASAPKVLFQLPRLILTMTGNPGLIVDVTRDHQRFLLTMPILDEDSGLNVVLNWQAGAGK